MINIFFSFLPLVTQACISQAKHVRIFSLMKEGTYGKKKTSKTPWHVIGELGHWMSSPTNCHLQNKVLSNQNKINGAF